MELANEIEEEIEEIMDSEKLNDLNASDDKIGISENKEEMISDYEEFIVQIFEKSINDKLPSGFNLKINPAPFKGTAPVGKSLVSASVPFPTIPVPLPLVYL